MRISMRAALVISIVACAGGPESADVKEELTRELGNLASYHQHSPEIVDHVSRSAAKRISVQLQGGAPNVIIAACEDDCGSMRLSLYDYQGNLVTKGPEGQRTVIISGTPQYSGLHELEISVPDCKTPECTVGIVVAIQEGETQAQSASTVPEQVQLPPDAPIDPSAPVLQAPNEPLPAEIPVDPDISRTIETDPFFASAPPIHLRSYTTSSLVDYAERGSTRTTTSIEESGTVRWLRQGIIRRDTADYEVMSYLAGKSQSKRETTDIVAANGLISLGSRQVYRPSSGANDIAIDRTRLFRLFNLHGHIFPLQIGNRFSYEALYRQTIRTQEEFTRKESCEITKSLSAASFHTSLKGMAYVATCKGETIYKRSKTYTGNMGKFGGKTVYAFFENLGLWMQVDPVNPEERLVYHGEPDNVGSTFTGTIRLNSIEFAR